VIVVDASVWVRALVDAGPLGDACRAELAADPEWVVPAHGPLEVLRTLNRYERSGLLSAEAASQMAAAVWAAHVRLVEPDAALLESAWALRHNITADDAPYALIAQALGLPLVTADTRLARAVRALGIGLRELSAEPAPHSGDADRGGEHPGTHAE